MLPTRWARDETALARAMLAAELQLGSAAGINMRLAAESPAGTAACLQVIPRTTAVDGVAEQFTLPLEPWSLSILRVHIAPPAASQ